MRLTERGIGRDALRRLSFLFQDGMVLCTTLRGVEAIGLLEPSLARAGTLAELRPGLTETGFAHLRVGLRTLAQAGWLQDGAAMTPQATTVAWTADGLQGARHHDAYLAVAEFLATFTHNGPQTWTQPWEGERLERFGELVDLAAARWELDDLERELGDQAGAHLDGALASPALLHLLAGDRLYGAGPRLPDGDFGEQIGRLLAALGWLADDGAWTADGVHLLDFVVHLGLVGSYLPMFAHLPRLYAGELTAPHADLGQARGWHVQRELNVRASTAAHSRYFAEADALVAPIFDREPLAEQPAFVIDTGSADATWLARIDGLVRAQTLRGRHLDKHPLLMVAAVPREDDVERARATLAAAGADALVLVGHATEPAALRDDLAAHGLAIDDGLHVHAFVDHDRRYAGEHAPATMPGRSSATYVAADGRALDGADVEADLAAHLARWAPHVARHGLVVLEAHCVAPLVTARHQGALHSLAFDAYSGYSCQYPVERRAFIAACRAAGLRQAATGERRYPTTRPFVAVSLNHLRGGDTDVMIPGCEDPGAPRRDTWQPEPGVDLRDGHGLHELLYEGGDLRHPRLWASAATSVLVTQTIDEFERRLERLGPGDVIRVADYGTGTALAAIELLKACRERGFEQRLERRGVTLELHLVDIPSSWFALGFELLRGCAWTRFHSLIGADGRFRPLRDVLGGLRMDVVMSSMVFHLIRPQALRKVAGGLRDITAHDGRLLWNAPDLGPAGPWAVLFHDPNRAVREHWKALVRGDDEPASELQREAVAAAHRRAAGGATLIDDERADRRILRRPHLGPEIADALTGHFAGAIATQTHEIVERETLDTLLVPSNQEEFLPEIEDASLRAGIVEELMLGRVLPALRAGPASTGLGYNVHWTLGDHRPLAG